MPLTPLWLILHDIVIQKGSNKLTQRLRQSGFTLHEVETSEFMKAGGSVFCMKMGLPLKFNGNIA
jgi:N-dimethylarginine dimethylaminohydrolase